MRGGLLDKRVTLQRVVETQGTTGELAESWVDVATVWASVVPMRGTERYNARQVNAELTHKVTIRHRAGVTPKMRFVYDARELLIEECINVNEDGRELQLLCSEQV